jgi:hypothetical protein
VGLLEGSQEILEICSTAAVMFSVSHSSY